VERGGAALPLANGPRLEWARPATAGQTVSWVKLESAGSGGDHAWVSQTINPVAASTVELKFEPGAAWFGAKIEISNGSRWRTVYDGTRRFNDGDRYAFSPQPVAAVRISNLQRSDGQPAAVRTVRLGHAPDRFRSMDFGVTVTTGTATSGGATAWLEAQAPDHRFRWTLRADGSLQLGYRYSSGGPLLYRGVTFDCAEETISGFRWLGQGPFRVWKNRIHGTWFGVHESTAPGVQAAWRYPESAGYFAHVRAMRVNTTAGGFELGSEQPGVFVRVGTPLTDHPNTTAEFPAGEFSILDVIPAIGSKFRTPAETGPTSAPASGPEIFENTVVFRFD
jgi:hypothetical protein